MAPTAPETDYSPGFQEHINVHGYAFLAKTIDRLREIRLKDLVKPGVSPEDILVAGLIVEQLEEPMLITKPEIPAFKGTKIRGRATHCVHLVLEGKGLQVEGSPEHLYATGVAYGEQIGVYPFNYRSTVEWGGKVGQRRYSQLFATEADDSPDCFSVETLSKTPPGSNNGFFIDFVTAIKLTDLASEIKQKGADPKLFIVISNGIQVAHNI